MEKELPKNWVMEKLGNLLLIERGGSPRPIEKYITDSDDGLNWIKISDATASGKYIYTTKQKITKDGLIKTRYVKPGDFILSNSMSFGRPYIMKTDGCIHDGWLALKDGKVKVFESEYLYYLLSSSFVFNQFNSLASGSTVRNLNKDLVASVDVKIPPINEQNRIVEKLDRLFGQLEVIKSSMEKIPVLLKNFRQQVLTQAVTGKLTEEWREGKELEDWRETKLSIIADIIDPHPSHRTPSEVHNGIPYIGIGDIDKNGEIDFTNARKVSENILNEHLNRYTLRDGDFIFGKIGTIGRPIIIPSIQNYTLSANVILIKPRLDVVNSKFLFYYLDSPVLLQLIKADTKSTSQPAYGIKKMREQIVPLPSTKEQKQIVSRVESLFAKANAIEEKYKNLKAKIETLPQTILHKAFKGELTEQLESDGDARDLLEEIMALKGGGKPKKLISKKYVQLNEVLR